MINLVQHIEYICLSFVDSQTSQIVVNAHLTKTGNNAHISAYLSRDISMFCFDL